MNTYPPLTPAEYAQTYATLTSSGSDNYYQPLLAKPVIESFEGKPIKMLSIGAGAGSIETAFIKKLGNIFKFI